MVFILLGGMNHDITVNAIELSIKEIFNSIKNVFVYLFSKKYNLVNYFIN